MKNIISIPKSVTGRVTSSEPAYIFVETCDTEVIRRFTEACDAACISMSEVASALRALAQMDYSSVEMSMAELAKLHSKTVTYEERNKPKKPWSKFTPDPQSCIKRK